MPSATNKYFDTQAEAPEHPRIRAWSSFSAHAQRVDLEIRRPREGLAFGPARMFVTFYDAGGSIDQQDEAEWELELDNWLLKQHVKARDEANETRRFALRFKAAFRPISIRFGDGFFNSVLVYHLRGGPYGGVEPLAQVLRAIHEYEAAGGSKNDCEELIVFEITVAARSLLGLYDRAEAEPILIAALAQYLDERFHITERRDFGFA
ncbi:MAG: hypothetical protein K8W52_04945 [Deltaproteobacteria bacterium]|nr:hypothetical protein [Deltaproteobacteria bacterium]